jgi:valyl-tRNA synthetase
LLQNEQPETNESAPGASEPKGEEGDSKEVFHHPETGEVISKSLYKKLMKGGGVKKEKKEKPAPKPENTEKKEKKEKAKAKEQTIYVDETPAGEFKNLDAAFPESYQPKYVEAAWQSWWEKCGFYRPNVEQALEAGEEDKFVMVIPPPNVTGSLHLGHGLTTAIEDTLTRWNRMRGKITLWVPGVDHAGIATQSVVERRLMKNEGITRHDLGREKFVEKVWEWKETYGNRITTQQRFLGASVDWQREAFTMSPTLSRAVTEAFCKFHEDGLLYRDNRLINWSCALQSALSDIEVDFLDLKGKTMLSVPNHKQQEKYEFGVITSFAYKVDGSDEEIVVATTRLETMLGDTAVAVHPDDPRYKHLHGKFLVHPFVDRKIPIVTDGTLVDMNFGTGAVKVTPAHDPNDYNCGKRNNLDFIVIFTLDGKIAENGGKFAGMLRYDARVAMEAALKELGLFRGKEENAMRLGLCSRSGDIIEPMLTPQWYVNCSSMAKRAVDAVRNGEMKIVPDMHEQTWYMWLENIKDWCISRQLWWGHRIPAYFARLPGETSETVDHNNIENNNRWFIGRTEGEARSKAAAALNVPESDISLAQDEDVLDTWFSSGLFPFSVFGWPEVTDDFKAFFPTTLLETGLDILFFWVARMVMMSLHLTDQLPFKTVYLHAMVRDKYGRKMSKALGNVIDPLEVINGCSLEDLLRKIDEGNLPQKEVSFDETYCLSPFFLRCTVVDMTKTIGPCFRVCLQTLNSTFLTTSDPRRFFISSFHFFA